MISWGYYGQLCWEYLFGQRSSIIYKIGFLLAIFLGSIVNPEIVINFSDALFLTMAFPNLIGVYLLASQVANDLADYWRRLQSGEMVPPAKTLTPLS
jgi:AGCS family alanine or glycine:cation symporter